VSRCSPAVKFLKLQSLAESWLPDLHHKELYCTRPEVSCYCLWPCLPSCLLSCEKGERNQKGLQQFTDSVNDQWEITDSFSVLQARSRKPTEGNIAFHAKNVHSKGLCPVYFTQIVTQNCKKLKNEPIMKFTIIYVHLCPPLWSNDQSFWLQIQRSGFASQPYHIFWELMGLERGLLSVISTTEELLGRKSSGSSLENREYSRRDSLRWPRGNAYSQKLALTWPTSGGCSVGIVRSRTQATEFSFYFLLLLYIYMYVASNRKENQNQRNRCPLTGRGAQ
jgi:hypothetical protein